MNIINSIDLWFSDFKDKFYLNFIDSNVMGWKYLLDGLIVTLEVTFFAVIIGIILGFVIATVRSTYEKRKNMNLSPLSSAILKFFNAICKLYITIIRGTPVVVQLMILFYVIFASSNNKVFVAVLSFGLNSAAYVAEIIRGGIMSIDDGQTEAGRSLGFNYFQTMLHIIYPQVFKNILPALANEFIVLLKETSVAGYVALQDLTKAGNIIKGRTYEAFLPLIAVAIIYLVMVVILSHFVTLLERRLRNSDH